MSRQRRELVSMLHYSLNCLDLDQAHTASCGEEKVSNGFGIDKGNELTARDKYVTSGLFSLPSQPSQALKGAPHNRLSGTGTLGPNQGKKDKVNSKG
jgi:hypothetical protein